MIKDSEKILAVDSNVLFNNGSYDFNGFVSADNSDPTYMTDFYNVVLHDSKPMTHKFASLHPDFREVLACVFIVNPDTKLISAYKTATHAKDPVPAFTGSWSCGYTGHVRPIDTKDKKSLDIMSLDNTVKGNVSSIVDPIFAIRSKDLIKEISMQNGALDVNNAKLLGYVNNNHNKYSETHFTLVYALSTDASEIKNMDEKAIHNKMITLITLENKLRLSIGRSSGVSLDFLTAESFPALKRYINTLTHF